MSLVTVARIRAHVQTDLDDTTLQTIIDDEEAEMVRRCGAHGDGVTAVTETIAGTTGGALFLSRPFVSITSITANGSTVPASYYTAYAGQGQLVLLSGSASWVAPVVVTYVPIDDRARRRMVIVELVRVALEQTSMKSESVGGEYSYSAPDWEAKRAALYRRLLPPSL
jgi:hypothetical protein